MGMLLAIASIKTVINEFDLLHYKWNYTLMQDGGGA